MTLLLLPILVLGATVSVVTPKAAMSRTATPCLSADGYTADQIAGIKGYIAATDSLVVDFRVANHIPVVADTSIQVVADSAKCALALATFNNQMDLGGATASSLYLIRVGSVYVGSNPLYTNGEWTAHLVMDSTFVSIATYLR